jgi:hypothetical protein
MERTRMRKRIVLVGGPYDTADNPMSIGISVRDYIGNGEPPPELSYPEDGTKKDVYVFDALINTPKDGKTWKDNDVYVYVHAGLPPHEIMMRLARNYGKYESLVTSLEGQIRRHIEDSGINA